MPALYLTMLPATDPKNLSRSFFKRMRPRPRVPFCLLDDDLSMLKALGRLLTSRGFPRGKIQPSGGLPFRPWSEAAAPAWPLLDVWMPDMNGLEVQEALRQESPGTRIIFISGRDDPSIRQAALDAGAFGFLSKTFRRRKAGPIDSQRRRGLSTCFPPPK